MAAPERGPTAYEILGVHPSAPTELIGACYWALTNDLQKKRGTEPNADVALHRLARSYESLSDPVRRAGYNLSIEHTEEPLTTRPLPRKRFFLWRIFGRSRAGFAWSVDPYEVLGLHPSAPQSIVATAYRTMRDAYLRLPPSSRNRQTLLSLLDESYAILADPQKRAQLAGADQAEDQELAAPARDDPPTPSQAASARVTAAPSTAYPPRVEVPPPPAAAPPAHVEPRADVPGSRPPAATVGPVVDTVATGVRRVAVAIAAAAVMVGRGVATTVQWIALVIAALIVVSARFVARSVRSGWRAAAGWLRRFTEERRKKSAARSDDTSPRPATPDEVFLGRLASTVGESKTERHPSADEITRR